MRHAIPMIRTDQKKSYDVETRNSDKTALPSENNTHNTDHCCKREVTRNTALMDPEATFLRKIKRFLILPWLR
jgi:hypothetical protein